MDADVWAVCSAVHGLAPADLPGKEGTRLRSGHVEKRQSLHQVFRFNFTLCRFH